MIPFLGTLIGAGITAAGSFFGAKKAAKSAEKQTAQNISYEKEFAQNGIRWRVADAKAAGLSPLVGAGVPPANFNPVPVFQNDGGFSHMGQNLGRAVTALLSRKELETKEAQLQLIKSQANYYDSMAKSVGSPNQSPPGTPPSYDENGVIQGQANIPLASSHAPTGVQFHVNEIPYSDAVGVVAGKSPATEDYILPDFTVVRSVSQKLAQSLENDLFSKAQYLGLRIVDYIKGLAGNPPPHTAPPGKAPIGYFWDYNRISGTWTVRPLAVLIERSKHSVPDDRDSRRTKINRR